MMGDRPMPTFKEAIAAAIQVYRSSYHMRMHKRHKKLETKHWDAGVALMLEVKPFYDKYAEKKAA